MFGKMLKKEFDNIVAIHTARSLILGEVALFEMLKAALDNLNKNHVEIIHSNHKSGTTFTMPFGFCDKTAIPRRRQKKITPNDCELTCELADLFIITFDTNKNVAKMTCMQNKLCRAKTNKDFYADVFQLYLLKEKPQIIKSKWTSATSNFLSSAMLPSITSYGVFYKSGADYNMDYYRADLIDKNRTSPYLRQEEKVAFIGKIGKVDNAGNQVFSDVQGAEGLKNFGDALARLQIGSPIDNSTKQSLDNYIIKYGNADGAMRSFLSMQINNDYNNRENETENVLFSWDAIPMVFVDVTNIERITINE